MTCVLFCTPATPAPQQPVAQADLQAQWAEYYRKMGIVYYGQQGALPPGAAPAEQKV